MNDWRGEREAPLFYLGRSKQHQYLKFRHDVTLKVRSELERLAKSETGDFRQLPLNHQEFLERLGPNSKSLQISQGPAFWFDYPAANHDAQIVQLTAEHRPATQKLMSDWLDDIEHEQPMMGWLEDGKVLGICASVRKNDEAMAAGLEVAPSARRRGLGIRLTQAWAAKVQAMGKIAMYSTSEDNAASRGLAAKLNLPLLGSDFQISESM